MDPVQAGLMLGLRAMDISLGDPMSLGSYGQICDAVYLADQFGVHLTNHRFHFGEGSRRLEPSYGWSSSANVQEDPSTLFDDLSAIITENEIDAEEWRGASLDDGSLKSLRTLKSLARNPRKLSVLASVNYLGNEIGWDVEEIVKRSGLSVKEVRAAKRTLVRYGLNG